jgi:hypothetical protein
MKDKVAKIEKMPPSVYVDEKQLPAIRDWKVGETYDMLIKAKMVGSNVDMEGGMIMESADMKKKMSKKPMMSARFHIIDMEPMKDEMAEYDEEDIAKSEKMSRLKEKIED